MKRINQDKIICNKGFIRNSNLLPLSNFGVGGSGKMHAITY